MNEFDILSANGIIFNERPDSIPYKYRISYRVAVIVLAIKICSARKGCPLVKLHIINDALEKDGLVKEIKNLLSDNSDEMVIRFDSSLNRALEYGIADGLIVQQGNRTYKLSEAGRKFVEGLLKEQDLLREEKNKLKEINIELDEVTLNSILERWRMANDKDK